MRLSFGFLLLLTIVRGQDKTGIKCYNKALGESLGCQSCALSSLYSRHFFPPLYVPECLDHKPGGDEVAKALEAEAADVGDDIIRVSICFTDLCNTPGLTRRSKILLIMVIILLLVIGALMAVFMFFYKKGRIYVAPRKELFDFKKKEEDNENAANANKLKNENENKESERRRRKKERRERRQRRKERKERRERERKAREEQREELEEEEEGKESEKTRLLDPSDMP